MRISTAAASPLLCLFALACGGDDDGGSRTLGTGGSTGTGGSNGPPLGGNGGGNAGGGFTGNLGGSDNGGGTSGVTGEDLCGSVTIDSDVETIITPGNVLIIFDQSLSMNADWNGQARWVAASDAVIAAIEPNQDVLTIGAIFFPSFDGFPLGACDMNQVSPIDDLASANPQIPFMPGRQFIPAWVAHWQSNPLRLGTPIEAGMVRGAEALGNANLQGNIVVILVTDGEPTCGTEPSTVGIAQNWLGFNIPTYVIGLPGDITNGGILTSVAMGGGTNDFFIPADALQLQQELQNITETIVAQSLAECSIAFGAPPDDLNQVFLVVTESGTGNQFQVQQGSDGWELAADGSGAELVGATCDEALNGRFASVSFEFGCVDVPILR